MRGATSAASAISATVVSTRLAILAVQNDAVIVCDASKPTAELQPGRDEPGGELWSDDQTVSSRRRMRCFSTNWILG